MNDAFDLPVTYNGKEMLFPAQLLQAGYTHKFEVDVYGQAIFFEPDEEGKYRAIVYPETITGDADVDLAEAIASAIETVLR